MKTNHITVRPDRLGFPLAMLHVGKLSSAVLTIGGDIPDDIAGLAVVVEYRDGNQVKTYTAAATRQEDGGFKVYMAPAYFPEVDMTLKYHVVGTDTSENPRWLGTGALCVIDNPADGSAVAPDILPRNLYAYNPTNGLYYKVVAEINEAGEVSIATDQEGVEL